jgi:dUTP pyrophosphatase
MQVQLLADTARPPERGSKGAVGYDFFSNDENIVLPGILDNPKLEEFDPDSLANDIILTVKDIDPETCIGTPIKTGCAIALPEGHVGLFRDRSSYGVRGVIVTAGVIDPDYRGEVLVCLANLNIFPVLITPGAKIAQMLVLACRQDEVDVVTSLPATRRGAGGFGSTGG